MSRLVIYAKHTNVTHAIFEIITCHDYKIVNTSKNPHNNHSVVLISTFELREQASPISEGVTEVWIDSHLEREITWQNDTHEPRRQHEWPPFMMTIKESGWGLPHPSAVFHTETSPSSCGWPEHYPFYHPWSEVRYRPTQWPLKLLSLRDSIYPICAVI
jgi:hypothetical protein